MIQVEAIVVWAVLRANLVLMWFLEFMIIILLTCGLLVKFMNLEGRNMLWLFMLSWEGFGFYGVLFGLFEYFCGLLEMLLNHV